jgi:hypothetical protein
MTKTRELFACLAIAFALLITARSARAQPVQIDHTWVSSTGGGTACTQLAPCSTFAFAQDATKPGGVISVLTPGDYLSITITKSLTVRVEGIDGGGTVSGATGFWIDVEAAATDVVTLDGLHLNGAVGVRFETGGQLHVVRCIITNDSVADTAGIRFEPNGASRLSVTDTVITNMGNGTGGGIVVIPRNGGSAQVALERVTVNGNAFGIAADGSRSTGGINMTVADSMVANNVNDGIVATTPSGGAPIGVMIKNTKVANNNVGIHSVGSGVSVRVSHSTVTGSSTGVSFGGGGALLTFGNNEIEANGANGSFSGTATLK